MLKSNVTRCCSRLCAPGDWGSLGDATEPLFASLVEPGCCWFAEDRGAAIGNLVGGVRELGWLWLSALGTV
jgi:hypothetical protein